VSKRLSVSVGHPGLGISGIHGPSMLNVHSSDSVVSSEGSRPSTPTRTSITWNKGQTREMKLKVLKRNIITRLKENHRWLRIFFRQRGDFFSRTRRITILFNVVMTSLACNAIFYNARHSTVDIDFGEKFLIAFWSSLLIVPVNLTVYFLLSRSKPRTWVQLDMEMPNYSNSSTRTDDNEGGGNMGSLPEKDLSFFKRIGRKVFGLWPWWLACVGYVLAFLVIFFSTFIVLLYGSHFTATDLNGWLISSSLTLAQDIIINQPLASICGAVFGTFFGGVTQQVITNLTNLIRR